MLSCQQWEYPFLASLILPRFVDMDQVDDVYLVLVMEQERALQ